MTQAMELDEGNVESGQEAAVIIAVSAWLGRLWAVGEDIELRIEDFAQRFDEAQEVFRQRYLTEGVGCLGCGDKQFGMF